MGSGSSRSGRALRRLRSRDSLLAGPGETAPDGGTRPLAAAAAREAEAEAEEGADGRHRDPAAPPDGGDDTLRLLDELLAESAAWGAEEPVPRGPARPPPAAGAGSSFWSNSAGSSLNGQETGVPWQKCISWACSGQSSLFFPSGTVCPPSKYSIRAPCSWAGSWPGVLLFSGVLSPWPAPGDTVGGGC
nr:cystin-1 isoform X1 [Manis javanica]